MNRIDNNITEEKISGTELRLEARKNMEKGGIDPTSDRIQLNDVMLVVLVIVAAAISFTDFTLSFSDIKSLTALTIFLYIVTTLVYNNRYAKGKQRGLNDLEYKSALEDYRQKVKNIYDESLAGLVPTFCKEYKAKELREYRESLLSNVEIEYDEYREKYWGLTKSRVMRLKLPRTTKKVIVKCTKAKPIKLVPNHIFSETGSVKRSKLIRQSGQERERKDKRAQIISRAIIVIFGGTIAVDIILNFSLLVIIQWFARILPIFMAMITGEDAGYCCISVTETNFKRDQSSLINLFYEWNKGRKAEETEKEISNES
jgi:hypothetical protein